MKKSSKKGAIPSAVEEEQQALLDELEGDIEEDDFEFVSGDDVAIKATTQSEPETATVKAATENVATFEPAGSNADSEEEIPGILTPLIDGTRGYFYDMTKNPVAYASLILVALFAFCIGGCGQGSVSGDVTSAETNTDGTELTLKTNNGGTAVVAMPAGMKIVVTDEHKQKIRLAQIEAAKAEAVLEFYKAQRAALEDAIEHRQSIMQAARERADKTTEEIVKELTGNKAKISLTSTH